MLCTCTVGSRPQSLISVSSTLSSSVSSSRGSRKDEVEYDVPRPPNSTLPAPPPLPPPRTSSSSGLVFNPDEMINDILDVLEEEPSPPNAGALTSGLMNTNASSYSSLTISSNSSADNLGVWDDLNYDDDEDESSGPNVENPVPSLTDPDAVLNEDDEVLLDNWIKELESGVQRMSGLLSTSESPPPQPNLPPPPPPRIKPPSPKAEVSYSCYVCIKVHLCSPQSSLLIIHY